MNKTTKAFKMAIEALEWISEGARTLKQSDAIDACKEALESQEQEPVDWASRLREWNDCTGALPANGSWFWEVVCMLEEASNTHPAPNKEQEPVALKQSITFDEWSDRTFGKDFRFEDTVSWARCAAAWEKSLEYTHPAQPLNVDMIVKLFNLKNELNSYEIKNNQDWQLVYFTLGIRAAEQAHNIK